MALPNPPRSVNTGRPGVGDTSAQEALAEQITDDKRVSNTRRFTSPAFLVRDAVLMQAAMQALPRLGEGPPDARETFGVGTRGQALRPGLGALDEGQHVGHGG